MPQLLQPLAITRLTWLTSQRALLDLQAIQRIPGLAGYWSADPQYAYQDSAGYTTATVGGVVGQVRDISNAATPVARRNLLTYTEELERLAFPNTTYEANAILAPDGTLTAEKIAVTATGSHSTAITYLNVPSATMCFSVYAKAGSGPTEFNVFGAYNVTTAANLVFANVNLTTGAISYTTGSSGISVQLLSDGWLRISISPVSGVTAGNRLNFYFGSSGGLVTGGFYGYRWGAQLEVGSAATPYQKIVTGTGDVFAPGNHAYQKTTANKPYLRKTPTSGVHWLDSNTDTSALTATLGNLGSACTVAKAGAEGVTFTEGVTISSTYNIAPAFGFNGDVAIFNRALTASEKALVTRYMSRGVPVLGSNLVINGTFDTDTTGWSGNSIAVEDSALKTTQAVGNPLVANRSVLCPAGAYWYSMRVKQGTSTSTLRGSVYNASFSTIIGRTNTVNAPDWVNIAGTAVAPSDNVFVAAVSDDITIGRTSYFDDIMLRAIL